MKILLTTDFSENSKGAIRFAQTLAKQTPNIELVCYHAVNIMKPTQWSDAFFKTYQEEELARLSLLLEEFINATLNKERSNFKLISFVLDNCSSTEKEIINYAVKNKIDFICIATKGAGLLRKIIGTHTTYIINNSKIPVIVIPSHYKDKKLKKATYLSDFENLKNELLVVTKFTNEINLPLEVLHYSAIVFDVKQFEQNKELFKTKQFNTITLNILKYNLEHSIVNVVSSYVEKSKPELLIMFTKREKGFFESIFLPSSSMGLTYTTKVPVLIYSK